ncbi:O-antigen polymerase [Chthoniobacter flavus Ellin428]|uniref:O-antigen polymerase n=1 Tax=Chthoniobacter flavus Ellin428 TaxID=497964 RepID=B4CZW4_9BACT|nr:O-antigen ligase family protein [Chthoniobacter flavus]EDY20278.1 O-antigen polymerase [Chthoniobacter flavus Ellin428]TCO94175.1 O-antigen ligase [Chthoniobacter flavus]
MRYLSFTLFALALICIQVLIGGVKLVFSLPGYALLAGGALLSFLAVKKLVRPPALCLVTVLTLAGWVIARALSSPVEYLARADLFMVLGALIVYLLTVMYYTDTRMRLALTGALLIVALVHVVIGAIQFKQADNFMLLPGIMRPPAYEWRASGFYICPNHLAGLLEMIAMLALGQACWGASRPALRVLAAYCALMCLAGVAITGSRGGYLSVVFGLGAFAVLSLWAVQLTRRGGFWLMFAGLLVSAVIFVGGGLLFMSQSETLHARLGQIYEPHNPRLLLWQAALKQFHLNPTFGTGSGTYLYYGRQFRFPVVQNDPMHAHDDYLELLAEYGVIGAALGGLFLLVHLVSGMAGLRKIVHEQISPGAPRLSHDLALIIGALSAVAALLVHSVVDFNMHIPANALFVAFLFGLMARPVGALAPEQAPAPKPAGWWRWLGAAVALVTLVFSLRLLPGEVYAEKARVALRDERNTDAVAFARQGLAWEKKNPFLYGYLGEAEHFLTQGNTESASVLALHEDAIEAYASGLKLFPQDTGLLLKKAQVLDLMGRFSDAEEVFQQLLKYDPLFENVYAYYGLHWQLQNRINDAELCFRIAERLGGTDISTKGLQNLQQTKANPLVQTLMANSHEPRLDLPAAWILQQP